MWIDTALQELAIGCCCFLKCHDASDFVQVSQELRSILQNLIPELMPSQKHPIYMGPICSGSGVTNF